MMLGKKTPCPNCGANLVMERYVCQHCSEVHLAFICLCGYAEAID